jgi:hypothetical protein
VLKGRDGAVSYIIGTGIDITEQKEIEDDLRDCRQQLDQLLATWQQRA